MLNKLLYFLFRQLQEIRRGGAWVLCGKVLTFLLIIGAFPVIIVIRFIRPLVVIRFGQLPSDIFGSFAAEVDLYISRRIVGIENPHTLDIFYHYPYICNQQLKKMWNRVLTVSPLAKWLDMANHCFPGYEKHSIASLDFIDTHGILQHMSPHLWFTPQEKFLGQKELRKLGIPYGAPFVCFHARDPNYKNTFSPGKDWTYHNYRDTKIEDYMPAMEELTRRGYFAVRMGRAVENKLNLSNPLIIDYAIHHRTDFLDIYLASECKFFLGDGGGAYAAADIFRKPIAWANYIPLAPTLHSWSSKDITIPKKLYLMKEQRFLTFREILHSEISCFSSIKQFEEYGIKVVDNTPDDIIALVIEMDERLKGRRSLTQEDEKLQQRFWSIYKATQKQGVFISHIGMEFLRQNRNLLE